MEGIKRTTDVVTRDQPPFGAPWVFVLAVVRGPDRHAVFRLVKQETMIGADEAVADFVLHDKQVSNRHLRVRINGSLVSIIDQDSTNGTVLNHNPVSPGKPVRLKHLDEITLGRSRLLFMACKHRE